MDEWQLVPALWNHVRRAVDASSSPGQFILTGSAVPVDDVTRHSGALRFSRLRMRPMSLSEAGTSSGEISLSDLLAGAEVRAADPGLGIKDVVDLIARGGWPSLLGRPVANAQAALRGYLDETTRVDLRRVDGVARDPRNVARVIRSIARNVGTAVSARAIAADVGGADGPIDHHTVIDYVSALTRLFVIEDLPAWSPSLRSRAALRSAVKRFFVDPSLAIAALQVAPDRLLRDVETLGFLFESLVIRDLRIYAQAAGGSVYHYRDSSELEADAIVELAEDRSWFSRSSRNIPLAGGGTDRSRSSRCSRRLGRDHRVGIWISQARRRQRPPNRRLGIMRGPAQPEARPAASTSSARRTRPSR